MDKSLQGARVPSPYQLTGTGNQTQQRKFRRNKYGKNIFQ